MSGLDVVETQKLEHMTARNEDLIGLSVYKVARDRMSDGAGVLQRKIVHMKRHGGVWPSEVPQTSDARAQSE